MCSKLLRSHSHSSGEKGGMAQFLDDMFEKLRRSYERLLHRTLNFRALSVLILAGVLALTAILYVSTPRELAPEEDQGILLTIIKTPQYANLDYLEQVTGKLKRDVFDRVDEKSHVFVINGSGGVNQGMAGLLLKNWGDRKRSQSQIMEGLQPML